MAARRATEKDRGGRSLTRGVHADSDTGGGRCANGRKQRLRCGPTCRPDTQRGEARTAAEEGAGRWGPLGGETVGRGGERAEGKEVGPRNEVGGPNEIRILFILTKFK